MSITIPRHFILVGVIFAFIISPASALAQRTKSSLSAGKQRNAEKGLKDNRYFFYFINASITNLGSEEEKKLFREAVQRDIIAQLLYMKFLFGESFDEILKAQKILIDLYRRVLGRDIEMAKRLLNSFAPAVISSRDILARHYLKLGYRDAEDARIDMVMGDNFRETLYSMRLYRYAKAIKKVKHGKRYAFFSLLEAKSPDDKKKNLHLLGYDELGKLIGETSGDDKKIFNVLIHADNYYKSKDLLSLYDRVWEKPELSEIKEYEDYLKMR
ncbi:MAG: hypothetical protein A2W19_10675 [Spirochaetes bacterium RBG_16_49_21]|nr:MAG: hypothetical protein A2W19_10675 [Spirochaetes bacterium RBG_16_49_21]